MSRFTFKFRTNIERSCYPYYDTMEREYYVDEGYAKRSRINSVFEFTDTDYDYILSQDFGTKIYVIITDVEWNEEYFRGYFYLSDCNVDSEKKKIITKLKEDDWYEKINEIKDVEVDLCKIVIPKVKTYHKIPYLNQLYVIGDSYVTNNICGQTWQQPVNEVVYFDTFENSELWRDTDLMYLNIRSYGFIYAVGTYEICQIWNATKDFNPDNGLMHDVYFIEYVSADGRFIMNLVDNKWEIRQTSDNTLVWISDDIESEKDNILNRTFTNVFYSFTMQFNERKAVIERVLKVDYDENTKINENLFSTNQTYKYIAKVGLGYESIYKKVGCVASDIVQTQDNGNEINYQGKYFVNLDSDTDYEYNKIGSGTWNYLSLWSRWNDTINTQVKSTATEVSTKGYFIKDTMLALFNYFGLNLTWYSYFFQSSSNPITAVTRKYPIITQLTNVKTLDGILATKHVVTLNEIITFVCSKFNLSWHVENNQFKFEHIFYYFNNYSYTTNNNYIDLTIKICNRNSLSWASLSNKWQYDTKLKYKKHILKSDYESDIFGRSEIVTTYQNETSVKTTDFGRFMTDINYVMNSDLRDGTFFGMYSNTGNKYYLEFDDIEIKGTTLSIQNVWCMMPYCTKYLYAYNDYGQYVTIDDVQVQTKGFFRVRVQEVEYTFTEKDPDIKKLVKSELGIAFATKYVVNCEKKIVKMTLLHDIN